MQQKKVEYGEVFAIVGSEPTLGNWNVKHAKIMKWSDSNVWAIEVELPEDKKVEYKYIKLRNESKHVKEWQPGNNQELAVPPVEGEKPAPIIKVESPCLFFLLLLSLLLLLLLAQICKEIVQHV